MSVAVEVPIDSTEVADSTVTTYDMNVLISPPPDSGDASYEKVTKFTMGGGGGRYYREILFPYVTECGPSNYPVPFKTDYIDVGGELDHQVNRVARVGVRGGYIGTETSLAGVVDTVVAGEPTESQSTVYINPYFSFEWKWVGLGAGALITTHPLQDGSGEDTPVDTDAAIYPSSHLRFGTLSRFYVSGHLWEGVPLYSGGGLLVGGVGLRPVKPLELYAGYCSEGPYQEDGWLGRLTVDLGQSWTFITTVRFPTDYTSDQGYAQTESEYGVGVGISYRKYTPGN